MFFSQITQSSASSGSGSGSSGEDWASDSSSSSSSEDEAGLPKGRARWLKKTTVTKSKKTEITKEEKEAKRLQNKAEREKGRAAAAAAAAVVSKTILPEADLTPAILERKLQEIVGSRGRKGTDKRAVVRQLEALSRLAVKFSPRTEVPILIYLITAQFDLQRNIDDFMDVQTWKSGARHLTRIASILSDNEANWVLGPLSGDDDTMLLGVGNVGFGKGSKSKMKLASGGGVSGALDIVGQDTQLINPNTGEPETADQRAERERLEKEANMSEEEFRTIRVAGSLSSLVIRLDEEYIKSLQKTSSHSVDYVKRLRDEGKMVEILASVQKYYERVGSHSEAAELAQLRVEHLYYRHDSITEQVDKATTFQNQYGESSMLHPSCLGTSEVEVSNDFSKFHPGASSGKPSIDSSSGTDTSALISSLCTYVYQHGSDRSRTRAMLCHIFHHALHDRFLEARDLLLMSHLQETISQANDVSTMILYNRMMANLGLCAFRLGRIWDSHQCLSDICAGRVRELLAQGCNTGRFSDKTPEQEKAEKRRQIPYHQHINLDLLEACHLISAMLLEVPNMVAHGGENSDGYRRTRIISRTFRKNYDIYEKQIFTGPPEQSRDYVMSATRALLKGDWKKCSDLLSALNVWQLIPGEDSSDAIKEMLEEKVKTEGLRTYILKFSNQYDSLSLSQLCNMFSLSKNTVHSVISKMMINRELYASWDQPTDTIVLKKVEPSHLQILALQFAEKAAGLVEANERLLDAKSGTYGFRDGGDWKSGHHGSGKWGDDRNHHGGNRGGYHRSHGGRGHNRNSGGGRGHSGNSGGGRGYSGNSGGGRGHSGNRGRTVRGSRGYRGQQSRW